MLGAGVGRRQEEEDEVHLASVDRLVVDRVRQAREQAINAVQAFDLAMRNGNALAEAGRAEPFALADARQDLASVEAEALRRDLRKLLQQGALVAARQRRLDRIKIEEFRKLHRPGPNSTRDTMRPRRMRSGLHE